MAYEISRRETPKYGVVTVLDAPTLTNERIKGLMPAFEQSGAILMRYGTLTKEGSKSPDTAKRWSHQTVQNGDAMPQAGDRAEVGKIVTQAGTSPRPNGTKSYALMTVFQSVDNRTLSS